MSHREDESALPEAIGRVVFCDKSAEFILWDSDDITYEPSDSGVPCGTEVQNHGTRGWEVCGECLKNPLLKAVLRIGVK